MDERDVHFWSDAWSVDGAEGMEGPSLSDPLEKRGPRARTSPHWRDRWAVPESLQKLALVGASGGRRRGGLEAERDTPRQATPLLR